MNKIYTFKSDDYISDHVFEQCTINIHCLNTRTSCAAFNDCTFKNVTFSGEGFLNVYNCILEDCDLANLIPECYDRNYMDKPSYESCEFKESISLNSRANLHLYDGSLLRFMDDNPLKELEELNRDNSPSIAAMSIDYHMTPAGLKIIEFNDLFSSGQAGYEKCYRVDIKEQATALYEVLGFGKQPSFESVSKESILVNFGDYTTFNRCSHFLSASVMQDKGMTAGFMSEICPDKAAELYITFSVPSLSDLQYVTI